MDYIGDGEIVTCAGLNLRATSFRIHFMGVGGSSGTWNLKRLYC